MVILLEGSGATIPPPRRYMIVAASIQRCFWFVANQSITAQPTLRSEELPFQCYDLFPHLQIIIDLAHFLPLIVGLFFLFFSFR